MPINLKLKAVAILTIFMNLWFMPLTNAATNSLFTEGEDYKNVLVKRVVRADTVVLESGERIRLIGLEAPNPPKPTYEPTDQYGRPVMKKEVSPITSLDEQSLEFAQELLLDKYVRLEFDEERKDSNFQTMAYIFLKDGTFANTEILRQGFANLRITPPNTKYASKLREAYKEARREKRGLQGEE